MLWGILNQNKKNNGKGVFEHFRPFKFTSWPKTKGKTYSKKILFFEIFFEIFHQRGGFMLWGISLLLRQKTTKNNKKQ